MATYAAADDQDTVRLPVVRAAERRHPLRRLYAGLLWLGVAALIATAAAVAVVPIATGSRALIVLSGSMEPHLSVGSAAIVRERPVDQIVAGDVITYTDRDLETAQARATVITHRVVSVESGDRGLMFVTKGDANEEIDSRPVLAADVQGVLWYRVPAVGLVRDTIGSTTGLLLGGGLGMLLLAGHLLIPRTIPDRDRAR